MDAKQIALIILYIIFSCFGPILLMFPLWTKILNIKNGKQKILTLHIGSTRVITNQKSVVSVLWSIAILFCLDQILPIPFFTFIVIFILSALISQKMEVSDKGDFISTDSARIKEDLQETLGKIKNSISSIESLALELEAKNIEITEKGSFAKKLDTDIEAKLNEYQSWKNLSEEEKQLFISAVDKTVNKKGAINIIGIIAGSVILNLLANFIWSLLGNPDKPTLLEYLKHLLGIK